MMNTGVVIAMENSNSIYTIGMLTALLEKNNQDYIDLISPFILNVVPETINEMVDMKTVQDKVKTQFGFDSMPLDIIELILKRYSKIKSGNKPYFYRKNRAYYVNRVYEKKEFEADHNRMRQNIDLVIIKLQEFFTEHCYCKKLPLETVKTILMSFFESCGFTMAKDVNSLRMITAATYGKHIFWVARFILEAFENNNSESKYLEEIMKGFLTYKALYIFENDNKCSFQSKLKKVTFYLDCSLVINCLGYDTEERKQAVSEMIHLIRQNGGEVAVFGHTIEEAEKLLYAYANSQNRKNAFKLNGLSSRSYSTEILTAIASTVSENLYQRERIETVPNPEYSKAGLDSIQDEKAITNWLRESRKNGSKNSGRHIDSNDKYDYDTKSLASIGMLRKNHHPTKIEFCEAVLVTQDPWLSRCMKTLYPNRFTHETDYAILDIDLVSLLWLSNYTKKSSLPAEILIANAAAACELSQEVMDRAIEIADQLAENGDLPSDAALIIRSQQSIKTHLLDVTQNDITEINPENIKNVVSRFVRAEAEKDITAAKMAVNAEYQRELNDKTTQIESLEDENARLYNELNKIRAKEHKKEEIRNQIAANAEKKANKVSNTIKIAFFVLLFLIVAVTVIMWCVMEFSALFAAPNLWLTLLFAAIDIFSVLQLLDFSFNSNGIVKRVFKRIQDSVYSHCYSREISKHDYKM